MRLRIFNFHLPGRLCSTGPVAIFAILLGLHHAAFSQSNDSTLQELIVDFEIRPRAEYRNNFALQAADSAMPEFYISQRNRLGITYRRSRVKVHASIQEIHLWNKSGRTSTVGSINAYELYIEPSITKNLFVRIGRQSLSLDNGRMFSAAPWSQQGRAHEGIRIFYNPKKITTDLTIAFTRKYSDHYQESYSPVASHDYKALLVHHLKYKFNNQWDLTTINAADVFENNDENKYVRVTNGGRVEYSSDDIYLTLSAYYQWGETNDSRSIRAYYLQPEISKVFGHTTVRLGAEILSGQSAAVHKDVTYSFVPLYGVAWKFMGNMNFFTRFPRDVNDRGLVNPYLFIIWQAGEKLMFRNDAHLFYSQYPLIDQKNNTSGKYLGFENDLSVRYKPVKKVEIIYGFSILFAEKSMELLNKVKDAGKIPVWSYLMISYNPTIFQHRKTR